MRSPFPGMDPFIEAQGLWEDYHNKLMGDMERMMGDRNSSGAIEPGETPVTLPYVLWSAGVDELWGLNSAGKTDDVTNFDLPPDLLK